eukprot:SAG11_NODE_5575_length_1519_cov_2.075352_2_plen_80_part_00
MADVCECVVWCSSGVVVVMCVSGVVVGVTVVVRFQLRVMTEELEQAVCVGLRLRGVVPPAGKVGQTTLVETGPEADRVG